MWNWDEKRPLLTFVEGSKIHLSQEVVEATQWPLTDEGINKMWFVSTLEYYSALKKEGDSATCYTWMNLEDVALGKKAVTKGHIQYNATWTRNLKWLYSWQQ